MCMSCRYTVELTIKDIFIHFGSYIRYKLNDYFAASELKDPICHSDECQIGSFSSEATICYIALSGEYHDKEYINISE